MIAAAGDAGTFTGADLYANAGELHDVVAGSNAQWHQCKGSYICNAEPGYDGPTGLGTPDGLDAFTESAP